MQLGDLGKARSGLFQIRAGVDDFLFLGAFLGLFLFLGCTGRCDLELGRVLRLRDDIGRIGIDEADDDVDDATLTCLEGT